jgi:uncharacterized C2H2 Zn-finger protein
MGSEDEERVVTVMKCPKCGQEMEEGYVTLMPSHNAWLYWSREQLPGFWGRVKGNEIWKERVTLMQKLIARDGNSFSKGSRCANCRLVLFEY